MSKDVISWRQIDALVEGKDRMLGRVIEEACRKINYHEEQIESGLRSLENRCESVRRALTRGLSLNELGEFQSQPQDIDRHIAQRSTAWQTLGLVLSKEETQGLLDEIRARNPE